MKGHCLETEVLNAYPLTVIVMECMNYHKCRLLVENSQNLLLSSSPLAEYPIEVKSYLMPSEKIE